MATQNELSAQQIAAPAFILLENSPKPKPDIVETMKKSSATRVMRRLQCSALGPIEPAGTGKNIVDGEGISIIATHTSYERMQG